MDNLSEEKIFSAVDEDVLWKQVTEDLAGVQDLLEYHVVLQQEGRRVLLDIDVDLGGGFDSGTASTTFSSYLYSRDNFRFAIHKQNFLDEIGKFFGMQDIVLGYPEFDKRFVVKTNDESRCALLFADPGLRATLVSLPELSFGVVQYLLQPDDGKAPFLELRIEDGIPDPALLRKIYHAFYKILEQMG